MAETPSPPNGRRAVAVRNTELILEAARAVFIADPEAPISAVAERAGVGMSALYTRYEGKQDLLRQLCGDGLARYIAIAEAALADGGNPWRAFARFMRAVVDADTVSLVQRLAGTFEPTPELFSASERAHAFTVQLLERSQRAGVVRADLAADDISLIFEALAAVRIGDAARTRQLRRRYLRLHLDALRDTQAEPLPGRPPQPRELGARWMPRASGG